MASSYWAIDTWFRYNNYRYFDDRIYLRVVGEHPMLNEEAYLYESDELTENDRYWDAGYFEQEEQRWASIQKEIKHIREAYQDRLDGALQKDRSLYEEFKNGKEQGHPNLQRALAYRKKDYDDAYERAFMQILKHQKEEL